MKLTFLIFCFGCLASFLPIYWGLEKLAGIRVKYTNNPQISRSENLEAKRKFLDCLRREAIDRLDTALNDALADRPENGRNVAVAGIRLSEISVARLRSMRITVASLFPKSVVREFDTIIATLQQRSGQEHSVVEYVNRLKAELAMALEPSGRQKLPQLEA